MIYIEVIKISNWYDNEITQGILKKKYLHEGESNFGDFVERVTGIYSPDVKKRLKEAMYKQEFCPAGRILYGAGSKGKFKATTSNCYILPMCTDDSIEGIYDANKKMARVFSYGGGAGINISNLRPRGARVRNSAGTSTGAVSFLKLFNETGNVIGSNGRRAAILVGLNCNHPDLYEYLHIKENEEKLASMNISVLFTDEFMEAVEQDKEYTLSFDVTATGEHIERKIKAKDFFKEFCDTNRDWGDPGALFIDRARKDNLLAGYDEYHIDISNPCVSGDTLILTKDGYERIKDTEGEEVTIWNGYQWSKVTPRVTGHNQKMLRVTLSNGMSLDCTRYHKWILADGSRVRTEGLRVSDKLQKWVYPIIQGDENNNPAEQDAYTNGFYSGDGTTGKSQIVIYGEKHRVIPYLDAEHTYRRNEDATLVYLNKTPLGKDYVPGANTTIQYRLDWLAGLIDSDGSKNGKESSISITSINKRFLKEVQLMLTTLGCPSTVAVMKEADDKPMPANNGTGETKIYHTHTCYRVTISPWHVLDLIKLGLTLRRVQVNPMPARNAARFIYVTAIEEIPDAETVYCFTEPFNHSGIFNGVMTAQCGEYLGNAWNTCLLSSVNLYSCIDDKFTPNAHINHKKLEELTRLGIDVLDETLDYGLDMLPFKENVECALDWRAVGLGVFGLGDAMVALGIKYGSKESLIAVDDMFNTMHISALDESCELAKKYAPFRKYDWEKTKKSIFMQGLEYGYPDLYEKIKRHGLRNGSLLSVAPAGTIALFMGAFTGGVEPIYQLFYDRTTHSMEGEQKSFRVYSAAVRDLVDFHKLPHNISKEELKKRFPFLTESHDIDPLDRVHMQEVMQDYVDNAISSTVNLKKGTTSDVIYKIYMEAWKARLKGITVFVDGCKRGNILGVSKSEKNVSFDGTPPFDSIEPESRRNTDLVRGATVREATSCVKSMYVTVNQTDDGHTFEVFTNPSGGCRSNIATITRLISLGLRSGIKRKRIIEELRASQCEACQVLRRQGKKVSLSCSNAIADAMEKVIGKAEVPMEQAINKPCPECGKKTLIPEGKCVTCTNCGWSKCE